MKIKAVTEKSCRIVCSLESFWTFKTGQLFLCLITTEVRPLTRSMTPGLHPVF